MYVSFADQGVQQQAESMHQEEEQQELEEQEKQWWHGTFIKAGKMGNMAADVLQGGPDKKVSNLMALVRLAARLVAHARLFCNPCDMGIAHDHEPMRRPHNGFRLSANNQHLC